MPAPKIVLNEKPGDYLYEKSYTVQPYEADQRNVARPVALLNYLQSAAGDHALVLGVAVSDLRRNGHTWVLSRIHLDMERYPRGGEAVHIKTWPAARDTLFTIRDFELFDEAGGLIGRATTSWAVLNVATRRPVKLNDVLPQFPIIPRRALADTFTQLPLSDEWRHALSLPVLRSDLDINRHVNNTVYVGWALETIPDEVDNGCRMSSVEISFRAEALYGDTIVARIAQGDEPGCYIHRIENERDGRELARLRTCWLPHSHTFD